MLSKLLNRNWSTVWMEDTNNVVKTGPTDVNSVRAVVINGTITIIVNGKTVKKVRAEIPAGDLRFGLGAGRSKPSATPLWFPVRSYMVTAGE